jgi:hypothetical protein
MSSPEGAERAALIAAKGDVQARLGRARRELDRSQSALDGATGLRRRLLVRRVRALESEVDRLMAEEMRLRLAIDRAPR